MKKILVVDMDKEYLILLGYLFQSDSCSAMITYVSDPRELEDIKVDHYDCCLSAYRMGSWGTAVDVYKYLTEEGFDGRFIVVSMASKTRIFKEMIAAGFERVEVIEKGRSALIRRLLKEVEESESFALA